MKPLFGKTKTVNYFKNVIASDMLGHLYIIDAPEGQGKKTVADFIAAMLHCTFQNSPCGSCPSCIKHASHNHPDRILITPKEKGSSIGIDVVREMVSSAYIKPLISEKKIYIISDAQKLTAEAQNALLKILEEPPSYVCIFLLVTSCDALLRTVLSRGIVIKLDGNTDDEVLSFITQYFPDKSDGEAGLISSFACGNIGVAKDMCENEEFLKMRRALYLALSSFTGRQKSAIFDVLNIFEKNKNETSTLLELLNIWFRDALYLKTVQDDEGIISADYKADISTFASGARAEGIIKATEHINRTAATIQKGSNLTLWITDMLIKCWEDLYG